MLKTLRQKLHDEKGQSVVEFAIIMPLILLIIMAMIYFGLFIFAKSVVLFSAHQGGREALNFRTNIQYSEQQKEQFIKNASLQVLQMLPVGASPPEVETIKNENTGLIQITVTYYFKLSLPFIKEITGTNSQPVKSEVFYRFAPPQEI
ncbi:TadE/TadG family type IV pilus assembly protein [Paenibacillus qinlingensis]|uniref:Flp pilus assembly pilin Flp n=1 Tax=Paenibacillus qinlingensis TaxID=1837343 RepID=A0ABU1NW56_9BACL|nr:TadE/TadG family type IV pilus assembly protein [Paenibacillus qinlingensis]MDR6551569.1 Flp pilus assembly pilin Flp [Paenibacillus qinlingensis]